MFLSKVLSRALLRRDFSSSKSLYMTSMEDKLNIQKGANIVGALPRSLLFAGTASGEDVATSGSYCNEWRAQQLLMADK